MKVNITGKGIIPGINTIPPAYNIELDETQIRRLLNFNNIRVYEATSGCLITKKNIKTVLTASSSIVDTSLNVNNDNDVKVEKEMYKEDIEKFKNQLKIKKQLLKNYKKL